MVFRVCVCVCRLRALGAGRLCQIAICEWINHKTARVRVLWTKFIIILWATYSLYIFYHASKWTSGQRAAAGAESASYDRPTTSANRNIMANLFLSNCACRSYIVGPWMYRTCFLCGSAFLSQCSSALRHSEVSKLAKISLSIRQVHGTHHSGDGIFSAPRKINLLFFALAFDLFGLWASE